MQITWKGQTCVLITGQRAKGEQVTILVNPLDADSGLKMSSVDCDILAFTADHTKDDLKIAKGEPFLVDTPGEYDIKGVAILGISISTDSGEETIYSFGLEEMKVCHLGDLRQKELTEEQVEKIGDVDILLIPVGGNGGISADEARKIILQIEPKVAIPIRYRIPGLKQKLDGPEGFLKIMGAKAAETFPKLVVRKKDLTNEETKVIILNP